MFHFLTEVMKYASLLLKGGCMLAKRTYKNQITIPAGVIKDFEGVEYFDVQKRGQEIVLKPVTINVSSSLEQVREKIDQLGMTEKDINDAVRWARRKS